jgi:hypothetical protein
LRIALSASKTASCTIAVARLERAGPACSAAIDGWPGKAGVASSARVVKATSFHHARRRFASGPAGGL